jgi:hypothetical protein
MTEAEFQSFLRKEAEEILDISVDKVMNELANKVVEEEMQISDSLEKEHVELGAGRLSEAGSYTICG